MSSGLDEFAAELAKWPFELAEWPFELEAALIIYRIKAKPDVDWSKFTTVTQVLCAYGDHSSNCGHENTA